MRIYFFAFIALLVAIAGYAFATNPVGCEKLITDAFSLGKSVSPLHVTSDGGTPMAPLTKDELVGVDGNPFHFPAGESAATIQFYAIYYAALDDAPSHDFTPKLVDWYKKFKPNHRNFELIFVSNDPDKITMASYMKQMAMPWPAFQFNDLKRDGQGIEKFAANGMPDLVLVNSDGKVLSDSFNWSGTYLGPQHVLDDTAKIVPPSAPLPPPQADVSFNPSLPPIKLWEPPSVMPAQPNWTWTMSDGTVYQNVVVTEINADTVAITHSLGVARVSTDLVPPDIQKQLNYDPDASGSARQAPYTVDTRIDANFTAQKLHRPIAWIATSSDDISMTNPPLDSEADLSQMAVAHIKPQGIIILVNAATELDSLPPLVRDQFLMPDDNPLPPGQRLVQPKIVFSNPDGTKVLGRVSSTQMRTTRELAIDSVLTHTAASPNALSAPDGSSPSANSRGTDSSPVVTPFKPWAPPDVLPAHPNWTWTTSDGSTYQDVLVTKIEAGTVSITHSLGVAHIATELLPPEIQKQLNYDPKAAAAAQAEKQRELDHPYYPFATSASEAEGVARRLGWPVAWIESMPDMMSAAHPDPSSEAYLTQTAVDHLKTQAVIIFANGNVDLMSLPSLIRAQLFVLDDGPLPDGHHFLAPKIVISDPDVTQIFGRISCTQMEASGTSAIDDVLASVNKNSSAQPATNAPPASLAAPAPPSTPAPVVPASTAAPAPSANSSPDAAKP